MRNPRGAGACLLALATLAGCGTVGGGGHSTIRARGQPPQNVDFSTAGWKTDFSKHSVPLTEFRSGGPPRDGIPPIDHPRYVSVAQASFLADREPVISVEAGGAARAYPAQILVWHEIVNDVLGGRPIAVTYCPLCNSALVFDRRVDGRTLTFGTTGNLRDSDLVMWDRQTQSWWQQIGGDAVVGALTGAHLAPLDSEVLSWGDFKRRFPQASVLSRKTGFARPYGANPYEGYDRPQEQPFAFTRRVDPRFPPKERVAAVFGAHETVVVPFSTLARRPVVPLRVDGQPVVVLYERGVVSPLDRSAIAKSRDVGTAAAFDPRAGGHPLAFAASGGQFVDRQTRSTWDITGTAVAGRLRGRRLRPVRHDEQFWFALAAFVPHARIVR